MAISSSTRKAGPFIGNDATTVFPFAFKVFTSADLRVVRTNALGVESDLVLDTDYTVALNANQDNDPGGTVTRATALPTGERLTITSDVEALQPLVLTNNGGFYPRVINDAFDKITIIAQQLIEQVGRSLKLPISSTASATLPDPVANRLIAWNSSANGFTNVDPASLATVAAYADANLELFTGNGTQTAFTLAQDPAVLANLDVSISGVTQVGGEDFTWIGTTLTFVAAPPNGTRIQVRYTRAIPPVDLAAAVAAAEADRVATAADRVQTGLDVIAAEADRVATAADSVQTGLDRVATAADRVQTGLDRVQTGLDRAATSDKVAATALLADTGFTLIKHKRPETGTYARTAAQMNRIGALDSIGLSLMHWFPTDFDEAILDASNGTMLDTYIQSAFDNCPAEAALVFPPGGELRTNQTIENPRAVSIYGNRCQWRGYFGADTGSDLLLVDAVGDQRQFFMRDLYASFSVGGRNVVRLFSNGTTAALIGFDFHQCAFGTVGGGIGTTGNALCIEGLGTHLGTVRNCAIEGGLLAASADRNVYTENLFGGHKGITVDLIAGAYSTVFKNNGIVSRDGVTVRNGDNIFFLHNQFEQFASYGANASAFESQLTLYGIDRRILNCVVEDNNFGGGSNCASPVTMVANVERPRFKNNQYNYGYTGFDVRILAASVKYASFDEQFTRGTGRDTSEPASIYDLGTATRGIWKPSTILTFLNGWTATAAFGMSVAVTESLALMSGGLVVGSAAGLTDKITVLPEGYRPRADTILACSNNVNNDVSLLVAKPNGDVFPAGTMPAAGSILYLPTSYRAKVAETLATGV